MDKQNHSSKYVSKISQKSNQQPPDQTISQVYVTDMQDKSNKKQTQHIKEDYEKIISNLIDVIKIIKQQRDNLIVSLKQKTKNQMEILNAHCENLKKDQNQPYDEKKQKIMNHEKINNQSQQKLPDLYKDLYETIKIENKQMKQFMDRYNQNKIKSFEDQITFFKQNGENKDNELYQLNGKNTDLRIELNNQKNINLNKDKQILKLKQIQKKFEDQKKIAAINFQNRNKLKKRQKELEKELNDKIKTIQQLQSLIQKQTNKNKKYQSQFNLIQTEINSIYTIFGFKIEIKKKISIQQRLNFIQIQIQNSLQKIKQYDQVKKKYQKMQQDIENIYNRNKQEEVHNKISKISEKSYTQLINQMFTNYTQRDRKLEQDLQNKMNRANRQYQDLALKKKSSSSLEYVIQEFGDLNQQIDKKFKRIFQSVVQANKINNKFQNGLKFQRQQYLLKYKNNDSKQEKETIEKLNHILEHIKILYVKNDSLECNIKNQKNKYETQIAEKKNILDRYISKFNDEQKKSKIQTQKISQNSQQISTLSLKIKEKEQKNQSQQIKIQENQIEIKRLQQKIMQNEKSYLKDINQLDYKLKEKLNTIIKLQQYFSSYFSTKIIIQQSQQSIHQLMNLFQKKINTSKYFSDSIILQKKKEEINFLIEKITKYHNNMKQIKSTKLIYRLDPLNNRNFHSYFDGVDHLCLVVKLSNQTLIAGYTVDAIQSTPGKKSKEGLLFHLSQQKVYYPKINQNTNIIQYDPYYIIFGQAQIRIKCNEKQIFSNFGIVNSFFDSCGDNINTFFGSQLRNTALETFQIYQFCFQEE